MAPETATPIVVAALKLAPYRVDYLLAYSDVLLCWCLYVSGGDRPLFWKRSKLRLPYMIDTARQWADTAIRDNVISRAADQAPPEAKCVPPFCWFAITYNELVWHVPVTARRDVYAFTPDERIGAITHRTVRRHVLMRLAPGPRGGTGGELCWTKPWPASDQVKG